MRILIAPSQLFPADITYVTLAQHLLDLYKENGDTTAVCWSDNTTFRNADFYECPKLRRPFGSKYRKKDCGTSFEDLQTAGYLFDNDNLNRDIDALLSAIDRFQPDLIIDIGRLAAPIAARLRSIPYYAYQSSGMYRLARAPLKPVRLLNNVLAARHLEQVLRFSDLYQTADRCFAFGSSLTNAFPEENNIIRLGSMAPFYENPEPAANVCIFLANTTIPTNRLRSLLEESFHGSSAPVVIDIGGKTCRQDNIRWINGVRTYQIPGSALVIHDGSDYLFNYCMMLGIPQIIITDASCLRSWNAFTAARTGIGLSLTEKELSVPSLYEAYRRIITSDYYRSRSALIRRELLELGSLEQLLKL